MLIKQLRGYLFTGLVATSVDIGLYLILSKFIFSYYVAKAISFLCATFIAYFGNRKLTFNSQKKIRPEMGRFFILYAISICCNVSINSIALKLLEQKMINHAVLFAVMLATCFSICLNFTGQKFWIFNPKPEHV